jgi:hypothetical protein
MPHPAIIPKAIGKVKYNYEKLLGGSPTQTPLNR